MNNHKSHTIAAALGVLIASAFLSACGLLNTVDIGPPDPTPTPLSDKPGTGTPVRGLAPVESIEVRMLETVPIQVELSIHATLPDLCTTFERTGIERQGNTYFINVFTSRTEDPTCVQDQTTTTFEQVVPLDVLGLAAGTYFVEANGASAEFVMQQDNLPVVEKASLEGMIWHDLCAVSTGEGGTPLVPTVGCLAAGENVYHADGVYKPSEPGIGDVLVSLGQGECPSLGLAVAMSDSNGFYTFSELNPGAYCVTVDSLQTGNSALLIPGNWTMPSDAANQAAASFTVNLAPGENKQNINFGWDHQFQPEPPVLPTATPPPATPTPTAPCDAAQLVEHVTIPDDTRLGPNVNFTKTWRLRNTGTCTWTRDYDLVYVEGEKMGGASALALPASVKPGESVNLSVDLATPSKAGKYRSGWQLRNASGTRFGIGTNAANPFWVSIEVYNFQTVYNFASEYCNASWVSAAGPLSCPGTPEDPNGFVVYLDNPRLENRNEDEPALWTHPNYAPDGWIQATYPLYKVQKGDQFRTWIGCLADSQGCRVTYRLFYQKKDDNQLHGLGIWNERFNGEAKRISVDLSDLAGKEVRFVLRVETRGDFPEMANAFWFVPRIAR